MLPTSARASFLYEYWTGVNGAHIADLVNDTDFPYAPDAIEIWDGPLEVSTSSNNNFGYRLRGMIKAPASGDYTFWISGNDDTEFWLSTDEDPANATKIAYSLWWTDQYEWDKRASQESATIALTKGELYYFEAILVENTGADHIAVAWDGPGISGPVLIGAEYLLPWYGASEGASSSPSGVSTLASRVFFSPGELLAWKERSTTGPFKCDDDYGYEYLTPGDYDRIIDAANAFKNDELDEDEGIWEGIDGTQLGVEDWVENADAGAGGENTPTSKAEKAKHAAFVYALTGDMDYGNACKTFFLEQTDLTEYPFVDFSDSDNWKPYAIGFGSTPGWWISEWGNRMIFIYACIEDLLSSTQKDDAEQWFLDFAKFFQEDLDHDLEGAFVNRDTGNYILTSGYVATNNNTSWQDTHRPWFDGDHSRVGLNYVNRMMHAARMSAYVGIIFDDSDLKAKAQLYTKEFVDFAMYPNGLLGEMFRSYYLLDGNGNISNQAELGYFYSWISLAGNIMIADAFARDGDYSLFNYVSSEGSLGSEGGNKSLLYGCWAYSRLFEGLFYDYDNSRRNIYARGGSVTPALINDSIWHNTLANKDHMYAHENWGLPASRYFMDQYLSRALVRDTAHTDGYTAADTIQTTRGPSSAFEGPSGATPGTMFMYADMQNIAIPYQGYQVVHLSDLDWTEETEFGYITAGKDVNRGGNPIVIEGTTYAKGIGAHAECEIFYDLDSKYTSFISVVGVDDEVVGGASSVVFEVWCDGVMKYQSPVLTGNDDADLIHLNVEEVDELKLVVGDSGNGGISDWADWGDARLIMHY